MNSKLSCAVVPTAAAWVLLAVASPDRTVAAEKLAVSTASRPVEWTVRLADKPVMVYASNPQQYKPYVKELFTTRGDGVLRDSPFDHLHHHALMYGIKVNGVNFWEEATGSGVQKVVETLPPAILTSRSGLPEARLAQRIHWVAPEDAFLPDTNAPTMLIEHRTLVLTIDSASQETALHWNSRFQVGTKTNQVTLTGSSYHGLGVRFLQELDPFAHHITAAGTPDLANNRQDMAVHPWEAVTFDAPGRPATIAIFGGTANARGAPRFFAMKTPFAYLSATQGLDQEPLVYRRGDTFELNYLVVLYPEVKTAAWLSERAGRWKP